MHKWTSLGVLTLGAVTVLAAKPVRAQAPVPPPPAWSPFLDCGARVYAIDSLICEDKALLTGARQVESAYRQAALEGISHGTLQADQLEWSKQRNMCAFRHKAKRCVERLQSARTKTLGKTSIKPLGVSDSP